jgi:hypothetical protein
MRLWVDDAEHQLQVLSDVAFPGGAAIPRLRERGSADQINTTSEHAKARPSRNTNQSPALKPKCRAAVVLCKDNVVTGPRDKGVLGIISEERLVFMRCSAQRCAHAQDLRCG